MAKVITLTEYQSARFAPSEIPDEVGRTLLAHYRRQVEVAFPTPKTDGLWQFTGQGWVGHIPVTTDWHVALQPKLPLGNIFGMLEYAYRFDFELWDDLVTCQSLAEFYGRLAHILARRVLDRSRQGFYRTYLSKTDRLPFVRGQLDLRQTVQRPEQVKLRCRYQEQTADVAENQILAWTLARIARSGVCTEPGLSAVRRAYRALQGLVTPRAFGPEACLNRSYHRLNDDYRPMHALCHFFLAQSGPGHQLGDRTMLPFLVDMARLYEQFVAEWLRVNLPDSFTLKTQEAVDVDGVSALIDLVIYQAGARRPRWVLDTKYKQSPKPANEDIYQVVAYAKAKRCHEAVLIYPTPLAQPLDIMWDDIHVRSLAFAIGGELQEAGQTLLRSLNL